MKKIFTFILFTLIAKQMIAQENWQIVLHKKILLTGTEVSEEKNVRQVKSTDWKKNGFLEINYKKDPASAWLHSIQLTDAAGNPLLVKDSVTSAKISTSALRKLFAGKKEMKIYMVISPPNPMMAAPSRMKHLATLKLP